MRWRQAYLLIAALAVPLVVSVHSEVSLLFAAGQIPGWHSTIFPPYFVLGAAFSGFAVVAMIAIAIRALFNLHNLVTDDHLDLLGKVLLACWADDGLWLRVRDFRCALFRRCRTRSKPRTTVSSAPMRGAIGARSSSTSCFCSGCGGVRARRALGAVSHFAQRRGRHVARALHDPGHQPLSRFPGVVLGTYTASFWDWSTYFGTLGLFMVPFLLVIRLFPVISIFETKEVLDARAGGGRRMSDEAFTASSPNSKAPEALIDAPERARARAIASSMLSRLFRSRN